MRAGIVHRDIKPQNCILSETANRLKLIDFGAAADLRIGAWVCGAAGWGGGLFCGPWWCSGASAAACRPLPPRLCCRPPPDLQALPPRPLPHSHPTGINYVPNQYLLDPRYAPPQQYIMSKQTPR